jgi:hypothetical protein
VSETLRSLLAVGARLVYDGQWWQVAELDGPHVLLASPAGARQGTCSPIPPPGCMKRPATLSRAPARS